MAIRNRADFVCPPLVPANVPWFDGLTNRAQVIARLVHRLGWKHGVELGLWTGNTIDFLLGCCPNLTMTGVDIWKMQPENPGPEGYEGWDHGEHERLCRSRLEQYGRRAKIIKDWTAKAAESVEDASVDFVFIDADHSEAGCRADIAAWLPKIKPCGWILGHDINWDGVRAACDDLVTGYVIGPDVVWMRPVNPGTDWPNLKTA